MTYQNQSINLSSNNQFDVYTTDGSQTPLAGGTQLTFGIVAYNDLGESPVSTLIPVRDEMKPISTITMSGLANNSSGTTSSTFTLALSANEFLDTDFSYSIAEANGNGGDGSYVIDSTAASYLWNADMKGGVFVFTVPTGKNASSDTFTIIGLKDNSMNVGDTLTFQLCGSGECLVAGCTDPTATNYNSSAVTDDGSCTYANSLTFNFDDGNYPSAFSSTDEWYVTNSSPYDGTFAFRTASGYYQTQNFTLSTSAIPVGSSVTVRFYGKGETSGDGRLIVNNGDVGTFDSHPPNSNSCCWGSAGGYGDTWYQYTYSFTTGPSSTNTFEWKFYTSENGIGYLDKIEIVW